MILKFWRVKISFGYSSDVSQVKDTVSAKMVIQILFYRRSPISLCCSTLVAGITLKWIVFGANFVTFMILTQLGVDGLKNQAL